MDGIEDLLRTEVATNARITIEYIPDRLEFAGSIHDEHGEMVSDSAATLEEMLSLLNEVAQEWLDDYGA